MTEDELWEAIQTDIHMLTDMQLRYLIQLANIEMQSRLWANIKTRSASETR